MLQVDKIVNSIFDSITWLLSETENNQVWIVDCGDLEPLKQKLGKKEVAGVLLTHAHFDHIYGLPELLLQYPNCVIYTNEEGVEALGDAKLNLSLYHELPIIVGNQSMKLCKEGDVISLFSNYYAKVYSSPGHHPSCLTYEVGKYLFTGDAFIPNIKVVTNLPKGNRYDAQLSVSKIMNLGMNRIICPGHNV